MATALSSEKVDWVFTHLLEVMAIMGIPVQIKTMVQHMSLRKLNSFLIYYNIKHIAGIPHNPICQTVIE